MKKLVLIIGFLFTFGAIAEDHLVTQTWKQIASANDLVAITAETDNIWVLWSVGPPAATSPKGMRLKKGDSLMFTTMGDLWAMSKNTQGAQVTVNKPLEPNTP